ncbi:E3 ubiquitin-protein ligase HERC2-like [Pongo pygmaeus]|uniref:E3 ubiquitin-protein ligase HERC2-like n=1 Tax=Pongo pygmaeus TaxID=9600 RepID=UPI00300D3FA7
MPRVVALTPTGAVQGSSGETSSPGDENGSLQVDHLRSGVQDQPGQHGKKVIDVAAGSTHCLALTEDSKVHNWRSNDQCQHFDTLRVTKPEPAALPGLDAKHIVGVTCGPAQSCAWSSCSEWSIGLRVPLRVDICSVTFEQLDLLLQQVSEGMDGSADWPPPQEKECMAVAMLNLPRLQVFVISLPLAPFISVSAICKVYVF